MGLEPEEVLRVLRAQYHDFLNRLQVVSGLLDLGRADRIKDYLRRTADEIAARGRVAKAGLPLVAWVLLRFQAEGVTAGIKTFCDLERVNLGKKAGAAAEEENLAHSLEKLNAAIVAVVSAAGTEHSLVITGKNVPGGYLLSYEGDLPWEEIVRRDHFASETSDIAFRVSGRDKVELFWRFPDGNR